jgi:hypothetical protein
LNLFYYVSLFSNVFRYSKKYWYIPLLSIKIFYNNELKYLKHPIWMLYLGCIVHRYNTISMIFWAIVSLLGGLCFQSVFLHKALSRNRNSLHVHKLGTCVLQPNSSLPFYILRIHLFFGGWIPFPFMLSACSHFCDIRLKEFCNTKLKIKSCLTWNKFFWLRVYSKKRKILGRFYLGASATAYHPGNI